MENLILITKLKRKIRDKVIFMQAEDKSYPQHAVLWEDVVMILENMKKEALSE